MTKFCAFLFFISFISCSKETDLEVDICLQKTKDDCRLFNRQLKLPYRSSPIIINENEIAFIELVVNQTKENRLVKYVLSTKSQEVLKSPLIVVDKVDFKNGIFTYSGLDWKVHVFSLRDLIDKQISFNYLDETPRFNRSGDIISYSSNSLYTKEDFESNPDLIYWHNVKRVDIEGNLIDSICIENSNYDCGNWNVSSWNSDNEYVAVFGQYDDASQYGIRRYDEQGRILNTYFEDAFTGYNVIFDVVRNPTSDKAYISSGYGLFELDLISGKSHKIIEGCPNDHFEDLYVSDDGNFIIAQRIVVTVTSGCSALEESLIYLISTESYTSTLIL